MNTMQTTLDALQAVFELQSADEFPAYHPFPFVLQIPPGSLSQAPPLAFDAPIFALDLAARARERGVDTVIAGRLPGSSSRAWVPSFHSLSGRGVEQPAGVPPRA